MGQVIPDDVPVAQAVHDSPCLLVARQRSTTSDHVSVPGTDPYPVGRATLVVDETLAGACARPGDTVGVVRYGVDDGVRRSLAYARGKRRSYPRPTLVGGVHWDDVAADVPMIWLLRPVRPQGDTATDHRRVWRAYDELTAGHLEQDVANGVLPLTARTTVATALEAASRQTPRLTLRESPPPADTPASGPLHLVATLHNDGRTPLTVMRRASHVDLDLWLHGPTGPVSLTVSPPEPPPPVRADELITLAPGTSTELADWQWLVMLNDALRSSPLPPGAYTATATYRAGTGLTAELPPVEQRVWVGELSAEVPVELPAPE